MEDVRQSLQHTLGGRGYPFMCVLFIMILSIHTLIYNLHHIYFTVFNWRYFVLLDITENHLKPVSKICIYFRRSILPRNVLSMLNNVIENVDLSCRKFLVKQICREFGTDSYQTVSTSARWLALETTDEVISHGFTLDPLKVRDRIYVIAHQDWKYK